MKEPTPSFDYVQWKDRLAVAAMEIREAQDIADQFYADVIIAKHGGRPDQETLDDFREKSARAKRLHEDLFAVINS